MPDTLETPNTTTNTNTSTNTNAIEAGRFNGMLSPYARDFYTTAVAYGFDKPLAHKFANDYMAQLGFAMKSDNALKARMGSVDKGGNASFRLTAIKTNKIAVANCSALAEVIYTFEDLRSAKPQGFIPNRFNFSEVILPLCNVNIREYVAECELWASRQTWKA